MPVVAVVGALPPTSAWLCGSSDGVLAAAAGLLLMLLATVAMVGRALAQVSRRQRDQRALLDAVAQPVMTCDRAGHVLCANPAAVALFGHGDETELLRRSMASLLPPPAGETDQDFLSRLLRPDAPGQTLALVGKHKDGSRLELEATFTHTGDTAADSHGILLRNVAQHRAAENAARQHAATVEMNNWALARASLELQAASRAKSEFLANMSHELRTPMTAILGFAENLMDPGLPEADRLAAVMTIQRNGEHLLGLINDILDISKIESGRLTTEQVRCAPLQLLADAVSLVQVRADARHLTLHAQCSGPIPETIATDPVRLRQILLNLIGNAIKFTPKGSIWVTMSMVRPQSNDPLLRFDVMDSGIGINDGDVERLFHPFSQADTSVTRRFGGTGLGLSISRRLAQMLGGDVEVVSTPQVGSRFRATIATGELTGVTLLDAPELNIAQRTAGARAADKILLRPGARILLAEDGRDNQRLIAFLLQRAGAEVEIVETGQAAIDKLMAAAATGPSFDLVLMDMQMPEVDGYSATRTLRERGFTVPILALTAHAMVGDREKCLAAGCTDYLTKPIDRVRLLTAIQGMLNRNPNPAGAASGA